MFKRTLKIIFTHCSNFSCALFKLFRHTVQIFYVYCSNYLCALFKLFMCTVQIIYAHSSNCSCTLLKCINSGPGPADCERGGALQAGQGDQGPPHLRGLRPHRQERQVSHHSHTLNNADRPDLRSPLLTGKIVRYLHTHS